VVGRREFVAGATALALSGCGRKAADDTPGGAPAVRTTSELGDIELFTAAHALELSDARRYETLAAAAGGAEKRTYEEFRRIELDHASRVARAIADLGGKAPVGDPGTAGTGSRDAQELEGNAIAFYIDMLPKVYAPKLRSVVASILAVEAEQLAQLRALSSENPSPDAFVYGFKT
jgi:rubrerythrin